MDKVNGWYGWRPDTPDHRDCYLAAPIRKLTGLPEEIDLSSGFPAVYDQGNLGSCTANAIAAAIEYDEIGRNKTSVTPSRLFIYYNERDMEGTVPSDSGAEIRDGIKSINSLGAPPESDWPYDPSKYAEQPPVSVYESATKHKTLAYNRIDNTNLEALRACLVFTHRPIVFGFTVYDMFESEEVAKTGILRVPTVNERAIGGHAVALCGYNDNKQQFKVRNSWGSDWGQGGYFYMPYEYVTNPDLAADFWVINQVA